MQFTKPTEFKEAVDKLGSKSVIGAKLKSDEWADVPLALRDRAFFSSRIENIRLLQAMKDGLGDFLTGAREVLPSGQTALKVGSRAEFVKQMSALALNLGLGPLDPQDKGTLADITSERRLGLIFDVQTTAANEYGNWKQGQDPDILDEFPAQRFIREADVAKPRIVHQQNEGVVKLKSDLDFWMGMNSPIIGGFGVPWGPWGFNSGMGVEDVDRSEAEELGLIKPGQKAVPVEKEFNDRLKASVTNLDPEMLDLLKGIFGDQVEIRDGSAWWKGTPAPERSATTQPKPPAPAPAPVKPAVDPDLALPPRERSAKRLDKALEAAGIKDKARLDADDIRRLHLELKEENPVASADVLNRITSTSRTISETQVRTWLDEFLSFIPPDVATRLPKLTIGVRALGGERGHHRAGGFVNLSSSLDAKQARRTLFHELMHWVHVEGSQWYKDVVREHYEKRTAGERDIHLPGYQRGVRGRLDKWYEVYAGRIYPWEIRPGGLEVPTRYFETLTLPEDVQASLWNDPDFRDTMMTVLRGIF